MQIMIGILKRLLAFLFVALLSLGLFQCAKRGTPSGGPKDVDPPVQVRAEPEGFSTNFRSEKFRIYFDEYIRLQNPQDQLIISPPLKYLPILSPQGGASKYVEVAIKDTLLDSTTYTFNFGQSIVDNNENNPAPFLSYVFSTGDYLDSLTLTGTVTDAFNRTADDFISVMLYAIDTAFTDSIIYKQPPTYITNTLDSLTTFSLKNLKAGTYRLIAVKDEGKNNLFDQDEDKIGFVLDTITLPTDSTYTLRLFREIRDFDVVQPSLASGNCIRFGYFGADEKLEIKPLTALPDTLSYLLRKEHERDTLNFWFTPPMPDSIVFEVRSDARNFIDTFTVKTRNLGPDSLSLNPSHSRRINLQDQFSVRANTPLIKADTSRISIMDQDSIAIGFQARLDSLTNALSFDFLKEANSSYTIQMLPETVSDFFGSTNDTLFYTIATGSLADYGNLTMNLTGQVESPVILQLTNDRGDLLREVIRDSLGRVEFNTLDPSIYRVRAIFDANRNGKWDTGSYLKKTQPERVVYYRQTIDVRANWELEQTFNLEE